MASNVDKARRPKRRQVTSGCNGSSAKSPVDCYITRGLLESRSCHISQWNYPDNREDLGEEEPERQCQGAGMESDSDRNESARKEGDEACYSAKSPPPQCFYPTGLSARLNLDVDLKCCQRCNTKFATQSGSVHQRKVSEAMTTSLILVIVESLLRFVKVKASELECNPSLKELAKSVVSRDRGIQTVTRRDGEDLSQLRSTVLPVQCPIVRTLRPGRCHANRGCSTSGSRFLRLNSDSAENRSSSIDKAPYSLRKSVRLPNCDKEDSGFEYVDTFNRQDIEDPGR
ncbi:hypothetical protein DPEC_G00361850 [Dallia pectoralis]|nr:hypothetical protein DPEC_G00361850 [Dallia pectoralis]